MYLELEKREITAAMLRREEYLLNEGENETVTKNVLVNIFNFTLYLLECVICVFFD